VGNGSASFFCPQATVGNLRVSQTECPPGYETRITNIADLPHPVEFPDADSDLCDRGRSSTLDSRCRSGVGARHRHIEEAPLLLNLGSGAGAEVRRDASIDNVEHEDRFPFLAFGGMDRRKDQIILVEQRRAGLVALRNWRS
jgi:hypothetical protein